jgi:hypothetical protein
MRRVRSSDPKYIDSGFKILDLTAGERLATKSKNASKGKSILIDAS